MKFFAVTCRCGHVGNGNYIPFTFAVIADNMLAAQQKAVKIPRVKHNNQSAVLTSTEISCEDYYYLKEKNSVDPYFNAKCKKDIRCESVQSRVIYSMKGKKTEKLDRRTLIQSRDRSFKRNLWSDFLDEFEGLEDIQFLDNNFYGCLCY